MIQPYALHVRPILSWHHAPNANTRCARPYPERIGAINADATVPDPITQRSNAAPMDAPAIVTPGYAITPIKRCILRRFKATNPGK